MRFRLATYDPHPAPWLPFPCGFKHDLSLITDERLPAITHPPDTPLITGWGSYAAVLDGGPIFVCRFNVITGVWSSMEGRGMAKVAQAAIAAGSEYTWERSSVAECGVTVAYSVRRRLCNGVFWSLDGSPIRRLKLSSFRISKLLLSHLTLSEIIELISWGNIVRFLRPGSYSPWRSASQRSRW
jgi:hypothetical protein